MPTPITTFPAPQDTSGMTPWNGTGSYITVNGNNYAASTPISVQGLMNPIPTTTVPPPTNNAPVTNANLNAATAAANTGFSSSFAALTPDEQQAFIKANPTIDTTTGLQKTSSTPTPNTSTPSVTSTTADLTTAAGIKQRLLELLGIQATKGTATAAANTAAGVDTKTQALTDLQNQAITLKSSYDQQIQDIRNNNPSGQLTGDLQETITKLTGARDQALASNATLQLVAQGNLTAANSIAQKAIDAQFQPVEDELDTLKTYFSVFQDDMTDSEKEKAQEAYQTKEQATSDLKSSKSSAVTTLINNGQYTQDKADAIAAATTPDEVNQALVGVTNGGTLTPTQITNGATNAGMDVSTFKAIPKDLQVFYAQGSTASISAVNNQLSQVSSGSLSVDDFNKWLDNPTDSNGNSIALAPSVKAALKTQATSVAKTTTPASSGGFMSWVAGLFGGGNTTSSTTVMTAPDGTQYNVPNDKVAQFQQNGYK